LKQTPYGDALNQRLKFFFISLAITIGILIFVSHRFLPNCDEGSKAVALARSLSQARLLKLDEDMQKIQWKDHSVGFIMGKNIPAEFQDLHPAKIRPGRIMLEGCMDTFVWLIFERPGEGKVKIVLTWGEGPYAGSQVLLEKQP
jgi:hypothetical protein